MGRHSNLTKMKSKLLFLVLTGCVFAEIDSAKLDDLFKRSFNFNPDYEDSGAPMMYKRLSPFEAWNDYRKRGFSMSNIPSPADLANHIGHSINEFKDDPFS